MNELLQGAAWWMPCTATPVVMVLIAATAGRRTRTAVATLLGIGAAAALALAVLQANSARELYVINLFIDPDQGKPIEFITDAVQAPGWHAAALGALLLGIPAIALYRRRDCAPSTPCPVVFGAVLTTWPFIARIGLEKCAAPAGLIWSTGVTFPMVLMAPFVGWWSGSKNASFSKFMLILALLGIAQRSLVAGWGFLATRYQLGTHLDVSAITELNMLGGRREFLGPGDHSLDQWATLIAAPQYTLWVMFTVACGAILGGLPFVVARRRYRARIHQNG